MNKIKVSMKYTFFYGFVYLVTKVRKDDFMHFGFYAWNTDMGDHVPSIYV